MISAAGEVEVLIFCITNPIDNFDLLISVFELGREVDICPKMQVDTIRYCRGDE